MKLMSYCLNCLNDLAEKTVRLSGGDADLLAECSSMIEKLRGNGNTPPGIANRILQHVRTRSGVVDPFASIKIKEFHEAMATMQEVKNTFQNTLQGLLQLSALGNSMDFFIQAGYDLSDIKFYGDVDKIEKEIYIKGKDVLFLGDNMGDFVFDLPLVEFLEGMGKKVFYAVKEQPVQNDLSMADAVHLKLHSMFNNIISSGSSEVGISEQGLVGTARGLWEGNAAVIAKGMGNYETISEFHDRRPVIHIMKVKCLAVADAVQHSLGTYLAIYRE